MSRGINRGLTALTLLALLAGLATPARALTREFQIDLDEVLVVEEIDLGVDELPTVTRQEPIRIAALSVRSPREIGLPAQVSADQATSAPGGSKVKRTGRWLKKHWWVPTLIGVAVGVVLLEPFDDDDDERRRAQMNP